MYYLSEDSEIWQKFADGMKTKQNEKRQAKNIVAIRWKTCYSLEFTYLVRRCKHYHCMLQVHLHLKSADNDMRKYINGNEIYQWKYIFSIDMTDKKSDGSISSIKRMK